MKGLNNTKDHRSNPRFIEPSKTKFSLIQWIPPLGIFWIAYCLVPLPVWSDTIPQILIMEESIQLAFRVSPDLMGTLETIRAAEMKKKQAQTGFSPKLSAQYSYTNNDKVQTLRIPGQDFEGVQTPDSTGVLGT